LIDPKVISFIKSAQAKGYSKSEIEKALTSKGWKYNQISEAFSSMSRSQVRPSAQSASSQVKPSRSSGTGTKVPLTKNIYFLTGIGLLAVLLIIGLVLFFILPGGDQPECSVDRDCGSGYSCSFEVCVRDTVSPPIEPSCISDTDCAVGEECFNGDCRVEFTDDGESCVINDDCGPAGLCTIGICGPAECLTDNECDLGDKCELRVCVVDDDYEADGGNLYADDLLLENIEEGQADLDFVLGFEDVNESLGDIFANCSVYNESDDQIDTVQFSFDFEPDSEIEESCSLDVSHFYDRVVAGEESVELEFKIEVDSDDSYAEIDEDDNVDRTVETLVLADFLPPKVGGECSDDTECLVVLLPVCSIVDDVVGVCDDGTVCDADGVCADASECAYKVGTCVAAVSVCGDSICDADEDEVSCEEDCVADSCGDGVCAADEDSISCEEDCGSVEVGEESCLTQITSAAEEQIEADIDGNYIVWQDKREDGDPDVSKWDVYVYEISTKNEFKITEGIVQSKKPRISLSEDGSVYRVVYQKSTPSEINNMFAYIWDAGSSVDTGSEIELVPFDGVERQNPDIDGDIAVYTYNDGNNDVYKYNFGTGVESVVIDQVYSESRASIAGDYVVYQYDLLGFISVAIKEVGGLDIGVRSSFEDLEGDGVVGEQTKPTIFGNKIVWFDTRSGDEEIYVYDILAKTEMRVTESLGVSQNPHIQGTSIVWEDNRKGTSDIYVYDTVKENMVLIAGEGFDTTDEVRPVVYGDIVVFESDDNIYSFDLSCAEGTAEAIGQSECIDGSECTSGVCGLKGLCIDCTPSSTGVCDVQGYACNEDARSCYANCNDNAECAAGFACSESLCYTDEDGDGIAWPDDPDDGDGLIAGDTVCSNLIDDDGDGLIDMDDPGCDAIDDDTEDANYATYQRICSSDEGVGCGTTTSCSYFNDERDPATSEGVFERWQIRNGDRGLCLGGAECTNDRAGDRLCTDTFGEGHFCDSVFDGGENYCLVECTVSNECRTRFGDSYYCGENFDGENYCLKKECTSHDQCDYAQYCTDDFVCESVIDRDNCYESDGGIEPFDNGYIIVDEHEILDEEIYTNYLMEYACQGDYSKPYGILHYCYDGAGPSYGVEGDACYGSSAVSSLSGSPDCVSAPFENEFDVFLKGTTKLQLLGVGCQSFTDECLDENTLIDYGYIERDSQLRAEIYECELGCLLGACNLAPEGGPALAPSLEKTNILQSLFDFVFFVDITQIARYFV
jgi:TolB protein